MSIDPSIDHYEYIDELLQPEDIHEVNLARLGNTLLYIVVGIILTVVHGVNAYLAVFAGWNVAICILIHLLISAITVVIAYTQYKANMDAPFMVLAAIAVAVTGIFGAAGIFLCVLLTAVFRQANHTFEEWFELIFPTDRVSEPEDVYNKIVVGRDENPTQYNVMPFIDVMEMGSEEQKRRALSRMTVNFHPRLSPAFRRALKDDSNAIRVQAATSVAKIENEFMKKLEKIEKARAKDPNNLYILYALARYYDDYAYTGILDREREILNREKAVETYQAYLQHDPSNADAWAAIGRLLFRSEKWSDAANWFKQAMDRGWKSQSIILWYLECLYRTGDYQMLRNVASEHGHVIAESETLPPEIRDAVTVWARKEGATA